MLLYFKDAMWRLRWFSTTKSPLKLMRNLFFFTVKALFVFKIFKFLSWLFKSCIKMAWLERSSYGITTWLTNNCNTPRSKGNQTMKFNQLIKYNMRKIFVEKSYTKCGGEIIPKPLSKKTKLSISLDQ